MANFCILPDNNDKAIGKSLRMTADGVAALRAIYEERHGKPLDTSDIAEAGKKLADFRSSLMRKEKKSMFKGNAVADAMRSLERTYDTQTLNDRANMMASDFSQLVDKACSKNPDVSRQTILKGYKNSEGKNVYGENSFFGRVFNYYLSKITQLSDGDEYHQQLVAKYKEIIDNWQALIIFAKKKLKDTEGIKLSNNDRRAEEADDSDFDENDINSLYNFEEDEGGRDFFQKIKDQISPFGTVGQQIRRLLSSLPIYKYEYVEEVVTVEGKPQLRTIKKPVRVYDDMGFPRRMDPLNAHQRLKNILRGCMSESQMMSTIRDASKEQAWLIPLLDILDKSPQLRAKFFTVMKKGFQTYSVTLPNKRVMREGYKKLSVFLKNLKERTVYSMLMFRVFTGKPATSGAKPVYNRDGTTNKERYGQVMEAVHEMFRIRSENKESGLDVTPKFYRKDANPYDKLRFLYDTLTALGFSVGWTQVEDIIADTRLCRRITNALLSLSSSSWIANRHKADVTDYKKVLDNPLYNKYLEAISDAISDFTIGDRLETKVPYKNRRGERITLYSDVASSFMTDFFDRIKGYVEANDKDGLKEFITQRYLNCPAFKIVDNDGKVTYLNKWIQELLDCCNDSKTNLKESFAAKFTWTRGLGYEDKVAENFSEKQHFLDMLTYYLNGKNRKKEWEWKGMAMYPMFILGDANVLKYIRAKRYSRAEIVDGLYNVYLSELKIHRLTDSFGKWLDGNHLKHNKELDNANGRFTLLEFLNPDFVSSDGVEGKYHKMMQSSNVRKAINQYLDDAIADFIQKVGELGLLEKKTVTETYQVEDEDTGQIVTKKETRDKYTYFAEFNQELGTVHSADPNEVLSDFWMNAFFAQTQQMQLMTISPAFYKNVKDLQKRYKEVHGSGTPLDIDAVDENGRKYSETGKERVVYFDDIVVNMEHIQPEFMEIIKQRYGDKSKIYESYTKCSLTDGQGYRTLDSYMAVLGMLGQLTPDIKNTYQAIKNLRGKGKLSAADLEELKSLVSVLQPLKPFVFTHEKQPVNNNGDEMLIPVQLKYAETVLIPELLPEGSKLRALAEWMEGNKIDLACATTAVKVGSFGSADISQAKNAEALNAALGEAFVHTLDYADMRIQTNLPNHALSARKLGTQIMKLIMAHLNLKGDYSSYVSGKTVNLGKKYGNVRLNGRNLLAFYNSLLTANILEQWEPFAKAVNNNLSLSEAFIQNVISNGRCSADDIMAFSYDTRTKKFFLPLFEGSLEHDSASLLLSMFRKVVNKQAIFGGAFVQVSAMGIRGFEEDKSLKYEIKDGNILWAECEMPFDLSYVDEKGNRVQLDYDKYVDKNGELIKDKNGEILLDKDYPHIREIVAYRMPTERECSMLNLKAVRYTRKVAGGVIKVPAAGTVISGWDFDADKLFFLTREFRQITDEKTKAVRFDDYDTSKTPLENSKTARNNMIFNLIWQRLADKETIDRRLIPNAYEQASRAARIIREIEFGEDLNNIVADEKTGEVKLNRETEDPEPNYPVCDPMTIVTYNQQNQIADKLIGMFANQNANEALTSIIDAAVISEKSRFWFAGKSFFDLIHSPAGRNAPMNLAEMLTAVVDAVKNPVLNYLGINENTAKAAAVLFRLGYNATEIALFFNQPVIKELCDLCVNEDKRVDTVIKDLKNKYRVPFSQPVTVESLSVTAMLRSLKNERAVKERLGVSMLTDPFANSANNETLKRRQAFFSSQAAALELFEKLHSISNDISEYINATRNTASNATGSTFGDIYSKMMRISGWLERMRKGQASVSMSVNGNAAPIDDLSDIFSMSDEEYMNAVMYHPLAFEQAMFDMVRRMMKALSKHFPYETDIYKMQRETLGKLSKSAILDAGTINNMHRELLVYFLAMQKGSIFDGEMRMEFKDRDGNTMKDENGNDLSMTQREYYLNVFPGKLLQFLDNNPRYKEMPVFNYLAPECVRNNNGSLDITIKMQNPGGLETFIKDDITRSWGDLANDDDPIIAHLATQLFLYNFYRYGFEVNPFAFMNLAPASVKKDLLVDTDNGPISYAGFLENVLAEREYAGLLPMPEDDGNDFIRQYLMNHLDNWRFVLKDNSPDVKSTISDIIRRTGNDNEFMIDLNSLATDTAKRFISKTDRLGGAKFYWFVPVINYGGNYYMADSMRPTADGKMSYTKLSDEDVNRKFLTYRRNGGGPASSSHISPLFPSPTPTAPTSLPSSPFAPWLDRNNTNTGNNADTGTDANDNAGTETGTNVNDNSNNNGSADTVTATDTNDTGNGTDTSITGSTDAAFDYEKDNDPPVTEDAMTEKDFLEDLINRLTAKKGTSADMLGYLLAANDRLSGSNTAAKIGVANEKEAALFAKEALLKDSTWGKELADYMSAMLLYMAQNKVLNINNLLEAAEAAKLSSTDFGNSLMDKIEAMIDKDGVDCLDENGNPTKTCR